MKFKPYAKAIVGGLVAGLTALGTALADNQVTTVEWVGVAVATLAALGIVYAVPNQPAE
ncbi:hypothetical protein [Micromonospora sp. CB01531]|uniref:hypothetical protein n=1 Tax=Micromonospora sp. CB01531 TaxID=1718947 RepID=UPI000B183C03|nr:hypothetical protein [Micromonospora sp. CB01531]